MRPTICMQVGTQFAGWPVGTESTGQRLIMLNGVVITQPSEECTGLPLIVTSSFD